MVNSIYCQFKDDEEYMEYYDINEDPYQLDNLAFILGDILDEVGRDFQFMSELRLVSGDWWSLYR